MIYFVNAKINIGLFITGRRSDGYHTLETLFYPVGLHNGTPGNPSPFCDILEVVRLEETAEFDVVEFKGRKIYCDPEKNLLTKALKIFREEAGLRGILMPRYGIRLEKHIPDGAGLGGGSADASFTLRALNDSLGTPFNDKALKEMALRLGADCPFFIHNRPTLASEVGEKFEETCVSLSGYWALLVKPDVSVSTKDAFQGVSPTPAPFDLRKLAGIRLEEWKNVVRNDFETTVFPKHPELARIKEDLYEAGALYAQMSGSGSCIYGLFDSEAVAIAASGRFGCHSYVCLL